MRVSPWLSPSIAILVRGRSGPRPRGGDRSASKVDERRHAESDRLGSACERLVELGDLVLGSDQADLQSFDFAQPSFTFGFDNSGLEVVADLNQAVALSWLRSKKAAPDTRVFVNTWGIADLSRSRSERWCSGRDEAAGGEEPVGEGRPVLHF